MRFSLLAVAVLAAMAGCSKDSNNVGQTGVHIAHATATPVTRTRSASSIAAMPDRGDFVKYDGTPPVVHGAYTSYPVELSEARALRAVAEGSMVIDAPDGHPIRLQYARHVIHPDGNWTWVGHPEGASPGTEAILTFGNQAVFGSIPDKTGDSLELTTQGGRTWMVATDRSKLADPYASAAAVSDQIAAPVSTAIRDNTTPAHTAASAPRTMMAAAETRVPATQAATSVAVATVDLVLGYTTGFATRWGGPSQALTRLTFMVDVANQAYANSQVHGQLRLVHAMQVDYPDDTQNRGALYELSGVQCSTAAAAGQLHLPDRDVNCTPAAVPASLQPLLQARERYSGDVVSLVRNYHQVSNETCGVAWLLGGGQSAIDASSAPFALSVVSDSGGTQFPDNGNTCRDETLAHELGHNMGLAHDRAVAQGADDTNSDGNPLDPEEYGRYPYSFGYKTDASAGNFYTIMAVPNLGQTSFRVFSNPRITTCGGLACGVTDQSDNALTLEQTMPIIAAFRAARVPSDFNGDGLSDILWHNTITGAGAIWKSGNFATQQPVTTVTNLDWTVMKGGDFDGDGADDILWRNLRTGANAIWRSGQSSTPLAIASVPNLQWKIVGVGDFDGDGRADIFWRNTSTGANSIWKSGNASTPMAVSTVGNLSYIVAGIGDFDNDGFDDVLWRNTTTGGNAIWRSGNSSLPLAVTAVTNTQWSIAGVGDFNADGHADVLWHNASTGGNVIWKSANSSTPQAVVTVTNLAWTIAAIGDFNGDGFSDLLWRNKSNGSNAIWLSGNINTQQPVTAVTNTAWKVVP